jgi:hypothetical protein
VPTVSITIIVDIIAVAIHGSCSGEADQGRSINAMQSQS